MRWGVRDESTDDHATVSICLEEIRACASESGGPNFVFLGGQKYGYRPLKAEIEAGEFEMVCKALKDLKKDYGILNEW